MLLAFLAAAWLPAPPSRLVTCQRSMPNAVGIGSARETPMSLARKMGKHPPQAIPLNKLPPAQTLHGGLSPDRRLRGAADDDRLSQSERR